MGGPRPKTLSERKADLELAQASIAVEDRLVKEQTLVGAERLFTFSWGDDGFYAMRNEVVALYASRLDYNIALRWRRIPESKNQRRGEMSRICPLPIELAGGEAASAGQVFVVFKTHFQSDTANYHSEESIDHS